MQAQVDRTHLETQFTEEVFKIHQETQVGGTRFTATAREDAGLNNNRTKVPTNAK